MCVEVGRVRVDEARDRCYIDIDVIDVIDINISNSALVIY